MNTESNNLGRKDSIFLRSLIEDLAIEKGDLGVQKSLEYSLKKPGGPSPNRNQTMLIYLPEPGVIDLKNIAVLPTGDISVHSFLLETNTHRTVFSIKDYDVIRIQNTSRKSYECELQSEQHIPHVRGRQESPIDSLSYFLDALGKNTTTNPQISI